MKFESCTPHLQRAETLGDLIRVCRLLIWRWDSWLNAHLTTFRFQRTFIKTPQSPQDLAKKDEKWKDLCEGGSLSLRQLRGRNVEFLFMRKTKQQLWGFASLSFSNVLNKKIWKHGILQKIGKQYISGCEMCVENSHIIFQVIICVFFFRCLKSREWGRFGWIDNRGYIWSFFVFFCMM